MPPVGHAAGLICDSESHRECRARRIANELFGGAQQPTAGLRRRASLTSSRRRYRFRRADDDGNGGASWPTTDEPLHRRMAGGIRPSQCRVSLASGSASACPRSAMIGRRESV